MCDTEELERRIQVLEDIEAIKKLKAGKPLSGKDGVMMPLIKPWPGSERSSLGVIIQQAPSWKSKG